MDNVIQFPKRNKGRVRKSTGRRAEGVFAMMQFQTYPENVAHIHQSRFGEVSRADIMVLAFDVLIRNLPAETHSGFRRTALCDAVFADDRNKRIMAAMISGAFRKPAEPA